MTEYLFIIYQEVGYSTIDFHFKITYYNNA